MALTKVRPPVSDISTISNGTTNVDIASAGADIDVTVSGTSVMTIGTADIAIPATVGLTAKDFTTEVVAISEAGGVTGALQATASLISLGTSSVHSLQLLANAIAGLTIGTDGKVTLGVEGTSASHLVTKAYVDAAATAGTGTVATAATTGTITIPTTSDDIIVKWGIETGNGVLTQVTFGTAFPSAIFVALCTPLHNRTANSDGWWGVYNKQTTGFQINQANHPTGTDQWQWLAIGY